MKSGQTPPLPPNYDEAKVPAYRLPDPLVMQDGRRLVRADEWPARRAEILKLFAELVYGHMPSRPANMTWEVTRRDPLALGGHACRTEVTLRLSGDAQGPFIDVLLFLPNRVQGKVPVFLGLNFMGNQSVHADPGIGLCRSWLRDDAPNGIVKNAATDGARGVQQSRWQVEMVLSRGYGVATACYADIDPDFDDGFKNGVHPLMDRGERTDASWGSIGAWAWGLSRIMDYLETVPQVDTQRVALHGHSRLGKTALWAGACDPRFALVISNNSGCGGAALSKRRFGETVARINTTFPHWFCGNFKRFNDREDDLPIDQHQLLALIAPRPVYVASAAEDRWADPKGEFLALKNALPVYAMHGFPTVLPETFPSAGFVHHSRVGYHYRPGKHDVTAYDWRCFLDFADGVLK